MEEKNRFKGMNIVVFIIFLVVLVAVGIFAYHITTKSKDLPNITESKQEEITNNIDNAETKNIDVSIEYTDNNLLSKFLINNYNVLNSMIKEANYNELKLKEKLVKDNMVFANVFDYGTQFDENHLFIYDSNGKVINYFHLLRDSDNDNNKYKYNGDFKYDTNTKTLTFTTKLWLGEGEEGTGTAFDDKLISELSESELERFKNYADDVKYEYKLENGKFEFVKKEVLSKLKNNTYYSNILD